MKSFKENIISEVIHRPEDIIKLIDEVVPDEVLIKNNKGIQYFDIPCSFDIETSSFYVNKEKQACMYIWMFGINGAVIVGRTWEEFENMIQQIVNYMELDEKLRLVCYVHNLSYEMQWIRKRFEWLNVFSVDKRKPVYAITTSGIEFRCSYLLSGYSLSVLGKNLVKYKVLKLDTLDYSKIRHSNTPIEPLELQYCVNDVKVVMAHIQEQIEIEGNITRIPLTNTGYVRRYCKKACLYEKGVPKKKSKKYHKYMQIMQSLHLDPEEYKQLQRAFQGGFTHANPLYSGKKVEDVASVDETSAYPAMMIACDNYPISSAEKIEITSNEEFEKNLKLYCCIFDIDFIGLKPKVIFDNYISASKCWNVSAPVLNNGRIVSADTLSISVTEVDYKLIKMFYTWDEAHVYNFRRYQKGYLPTDLVKAILKLYENKTILKGVEGAEVEYLLSKGMLNSTYGMCVTNICRPEVIYDTDWSVEAPDINKAIDKYNKSKQRFLFYPWGIYVTANARYALLSTLYQIGIHGDYIYTDTDSIKFKNYEKHKHIIDNYNLYIQEKLKKAMKYHNLPEELVKPKTIKGEEKYLGVWDFEGIYTFKTIGAKRYMTKKDDKISITVSGLNKKTTVPYLLEKFSDPFEAFTDGLYVPREYTGKNTHTYIDEPIDGIITDYLGNTAEYHELSAVHLEPSDYDLSLARLYVDYIRGVQLESEV